MSYIARIFDLTRTFASTAFPALVALAAVYSASAQSGAGDWMTTGFDAQRSSWVRADRKISLESMSKPGFDLFWKLKLDNTPRQLSAITPPALLDFYIGYRGFRSLGFFGGSSDRVFAVDVDLGRLEWEKKYDSTAASAGTIPCPGGMTSAVTRPTITGYPSGLASMGFGRGTPAKSGVGLPDGRSCHRAGFGRRAPSAEAAARTGTYCAESVRSPHPVCVCSYRRRQAPCALGV